MSRHTQFPSLYPILDAEYLARVSDVQGSDRRSSLAGLVAGLAEAGVQILQYRNKQGSQAEILEDAKVMRSAAGRGLRLILNDWPALAVQANFDGVHVGQHDLSPAEARAIVGADRMVGISTHSEAQLRSADREPVDYIAIGPVFATTSKQNPDPVVGLEGVKLARTLTGRPLVAIGGITLETAAEVRKAGADSIAVISAIFARKGAPGHNPVNLSKDFLAIFR